MWIEVRSVRGFAGELHDTTVEFTVVFNTLVTNVRMPRGKEPTFGIHPLDNRVFGLAVRHRVTHAVNVLDFVLFQNHSHAPM